VNIVGREALSELDNKYLDFADDFESEFVDQGFDQNRSIEETLEIGWDLLSMLPKDALNRIDEEFIEKYYREDDSIVRSSKRPTNRGFFLLFRPRTAAALAGAARARHVTTGKNYPPRSGTFPNRWPRTSNRHART